MNFLSFIVEVFTLLSDQNFSTLASAGHKDAIISLSGECDLITVLVEIGEVEVLGVLFEDLGDEGLELSEALGVD